MMSQPIVANTIEVLYLAASAIEADAQSLLEDFSGSFYLLTEPPIPVDEIAELHLQLILEFKDMKAIFPFADIHGAIWFDTSEIHELTTGEVITYRGREPQSQIERDRGASELFCRPLADKFQVSREAMRIRLESLNWIVTSRVSTLP